MSVNSSWTGTRRPPASAMIVPASGSAYRYLQERDLCSVNIRSVLQMLLADPPLGPKPPKVFCDPHPHRVFVPSSLRRRLLVPSAGPSPGGLMTIPPEIETTSSQVMPPSRRSLGVGLGAGELDQGEGDWQPVAALEQAHLGAVGSPRGRRAFSWEGWPARPADPR